MVQPTRSSRLLELHCVQCGVDPLNTAPGLQVLQVSTTCCTSHPLVRCCKPLAMFMGSHACAGPWLQDDRTLDCCALPEEKPSASCGMTRGHLHLG